MKPGDLVQPVVPENHGNPQIRIYDIPYHVINEDADVRRFPMMVGKLRAGELAVVIELTDNGKTRIMLSNGVAGWVSSKLLRSAEET